MGLAVSGQQYPREELGCRVAVTASRLGEAVGLSYGHRSRGRRFKCREFTLTQANDVTPRCCDRVKCLFTLDLAFSDFVASVRASKDTRLFRDEQRNKRGELSGFSKRFNRYKEGLGIKNDQHPKLDLHSFRHTLQTMLFDAGEEEYVVNAICGHRPAQQSDGVRTYSRGSGLKAKYGLLLKLKSDIESYRLR